MMGSMSEIVVKAVSITVTINVGISMVRVVMSISVLSVESRVELAMMAESVISKSMFNSMLFVSVFLMLNTMWISFKAMSILKTVWMVLLMAIWMVTIETMSIRAIVVVHRCMMWGIMVSHMGSQCVL
jgi:hypothetical protein